MEAEHLMDRFDDGGYVILRNFVPLEIIHNVQLEIERIVDELAEERVESGNIPCDFGDEPFNMRFKKIYENKPESEPVYQ